MEELNDNQYNREKLAKYLINAAYKTKLNELDNHNLKLETRIKQHIQNIIDYKNNLLEQLDISEEFLEIYQHKCKLYDNQVYRNVLVDTYQELTDLNVI